jgi:hypothetical protein
LRAGVHQQIFGWRQMTMISRTYFLFVFRHENDTTLATVWHYLMYREGSIIWKQIVQRNGGEWKATIEVAHRKRLHCTRPQGKFMFLCFNTPARIKSTLSAEKEPCKA